MSRCTEALDSWFYPDVADNWDDALFRERILGQVGEQTVMLDLGAGAGIVAQMNFRRVVSRVCGIDLDSRVLENPFLDEARVAGGEAIPYPDEAFDVVVSDNVFEHLEKPERVLAEIRRILKPGGLLFFKTPNKYHYMPFIARLTPHRFHAFVNRLRGRESVDTFPTRYRANTKGAVRQLAGHTGLVVKEIHLIESRPEYTRIFCPLYLFGIAWERLVNRFDALARFRILMIAVLSKPADGAVRK